MFKLNENSSFLDLQGKGAGIVVPKAYGRWQNPKDDKRWCHEIMNETWEQIQVDQPLAFKTNWLTNKFDGSQDYLVSNRIRALLGPEFQKRWISKIHSLKVFKRVGKGNNTPKGSQKKESRRWWQRRLMLHLWGQRAI